jgi:hypothetical protein
VLKAEKVYYKLKKWSKSRESIRKSNKIENECGKCKKLCLMLRNYDKLWKMLRKYKSVRSLPNFNKLC